MVTYKKVNLGARLLIIENFGKLFTDTPKYPDGGGLWSGINFSLTSKY